MHIRFWAYHCYGQIVPQPHRCKSQKLYRNSVLIFRNKAFMAGFCSFILVLTLFCSSSLSSEAKNCRKCRQVLYSKQSTQFNIHRDGKSPNQKKKFFNYTVSLKLHISKNLPICFLKRQQKWKNIVEQQKLLSQSLK